MSRWIGGSASSNGLQVKTRGADSGCAAANLATSVAATISSPVLRMDVTPAAKYSGRTSSPVTWAKSSTWTTCTWASIRPGRANFPRPSIRVAPSQHRPLHQPDHGDDLGTADHNGPLRQHLARFGIKHGAAVDDDGRFVSRQGHGHVQAEPDRDKQDGTNIALHRSGPLRPHQGQRNPPLDGPFSSVRLPDTIASDAAACPSTDSVLDGRRLLQSAIRMKCPIKRLESQKPGSFEKPGFFPPGDF